MTKFNTAGLVRINDEQYPGIYEVVSEIDAAVYPKLFDYSYFVTGDECDSEFPVKESDLIFVCSAESRSDI